ncbi:unnamed protein product [Mytilus edulis]|uniref:C1q domain-containing protein n=1 Tax=Mytilus edulis TaxID=6550 RepID=A0A8S3USD2_MYTED|nr:unnamed protein product [Mytilus edulis]
MYRSVYLLLLPSLCAFLLEPNNQHNSSGGQLVSGNHYLTISRFLEAQQKQHRDTEELHKTMDDTISVLASQLQKKFADLEKKLINDVKKNETCRADDGLEKKIVELEKNYTTLLYELNIAKDANAKMKNQLSVLRNETSSIDDRVKSVEQLRNIQSLQDLQTVKQQIQSLNAQTKSLSQNQFARNQDFLALYNQTSYGFVEAENRLQNFKNMSLTNVNITQKHVTNRFVAVEDRLAQMEAFKNMSLMNTTRLDMKTESLQTQITDNGRKVAIMAKPSGNWDEQSGYIVKFNSVKTSIGLSDMSSFKSSGKFKCEIEGLYSVSVLLNAYNTDVSYKIYLNGNEYSSVYEFVNKVFYQGGAITVILNLHQTDILWVQLSGHMYVIGVYSYITIVMIK